MLFEALAAMAVLSAAPQDKPQDGGPQRVAPRGDYTRTCNGSYVNRGRLYADCRNDRGNVRGTSIELNRCTDYEIQNRNGLLVCGPNRGEFEDREDGGGNGGGWGGGGNGNGGGWSGGRSSVMIFRDANYRGASFRFDNDVSNLANTGFNDQISSFQFRGTWEVCTDAYFRGRCQIFSDDVRNLANWGLNDRISSLRPVRRRDR